MYIIKLYSRVSWNFIHYCPSTQQHGVCANAVMITWMNLPVWENILLCSSIMPALQPGQIISKLSRILSGHFNPVHIYFNSIQQQISEWRDDVSAKKCSIINVPCGCDEEWWQVLRRTSRIFLSLHFKTTTSYLEEIGSWMGRLLASNGSRFLYVPSRASRFFHAKSIAIAHIHNKTSLRYYVNLKI